MAYHSAQGNNFHSVLIEGGNVQLGDTYVWNGRDAEIASIALRLFPVVIEIVDVYSSRLSSRDTRCLADKLKDYEAEFRVSVEALLGSIVSEEELRLLRTDQGDKLWKQKAFNDKIIEHLGTDAVTILETANSIYVTLSKLKKKLPPPDNATKSDSKRLARAKHIIKCFFHAPQDKPSLDKLEAGINKFNSLTSDATTSAPSKLKPQTQTKTHRELRKLHLIRECADDLYDAFRLGWQCECDKRHPANIALDTWWSKVEDEEPPTSLSFSFLFADDAENAQTQHWMTADVVLNNEGQPVPPTDPYRRQHPEPMTDVPELSMSPTTSQSSSDPSIHRFEHHADEHIDLCAVVSNSGSEPHSPRRRVGSLSDPKHGHNFHLSTGYDHLPAPVTKHSIKLSDTLEQTPPPHSNHSNTEAPRQMVMCTRHRVRIGLLLAWGVLQISSTGWLKGYWTRDNILLVTESSKKPRPYVQHRFESSRRNTGSLSEPTLTPSILSTVTSLVGNDALFALAIFLIEMCYGKPIEHLAKENEKQNGEVNGHTKFLTAHRLSWKINDELGMSYARAVRGCLQADIKIDEAGRVIDQEEFAKCVLEGIIQPLKNAAEVFGEDNGAP